MQMQRQQAIERAVPQYKSNEKYREQIARALKLLSASAQTMMKITALTNGPGASVLAPLFQEAFSGQDQDMVNAQAMLCLLEELVQEADVVTVRTTTMRTTTPLAGDVGQLAGTTTGGEEAPSSAGVARNVREQLGLPPEPPWPTRAPPQPHSGSEAAGSAGVPKNAVEPSVPTQGLKELNIRSAPCGKWQIGIFRARIETWKNNTTGHPQAAFRCILVATNDPTCYLAAQVSTRNADMKPLRIAESKYKENLYFNMTRVCLLTDNKQQFLHCPLKMVVDLGKTHTDPLLSGTCGVTNLQAQPPMTLREIQELTVYQRFDVTALVAGVDDNPRDVTPNRKVIDVRLLDASGPDGKAQEVKVSFFYNHPPDEATCATMDILRANNNEALSFFSLQGKRTDSGFSVETSRDCFILKAVGPRATELNAAAAKLLELSLIHI